MIQLARPDLDDAESHAIAQVLASGHLVSGPRVHAFETEVAARVVRAHAVAVANGTVALELSLGAMGVCPGDEVLVPALTWPSPAHAVVLRGAIPVLVDVDPATWNVTADAMRAAKTPRTKAAIAIDQFGNPAPIDAIADALKLPILEDAACAIGSVASWGACGSGGVVSTLSFHPRKILTTGEGGMCLTDDADLAARIRVLRNHGQREAGVFVEAGPNARLTEMQAAMGLVQLQKLDGILDTRRRLLAMYRERLADRALQTPLPGARPNAQTFGLLSRARDADERDRLIASMRERGVEAGRLSYALSRLPSLAPFTRDAKVPTAERIADLGIALPLHTKLQDRDIDQIVSALLESEKSLGR